MVQRDFDAPRSGSHMPFLVVGFALLFNPPTEPAEIWPRARNQLRSRGDGAAGSGRPSYRRDCHDGIQAEALVQLADQNQTRIGGDARSFKPLKVN
jgi:hypothetical protein